VPVKPASNLDLAPTTPFGLQCPSACLRLLAGQADPKQGLLAALAAIRHIPLLLELPTIPSTILLSRPGRRITSRSTARATSSLSASSILGLSPKTELVLWPMSLPTSRSLLGMHQKLGAKEEHGYG
jgi:hypothetical protein